jgi:hypothetical protein
MNKAFIGLTEKQLASLGRIAVQSAYLEETIDRMLQALTKLDRKQMRILQPRGMFQTKLDILKSLWDLKLRTKIHKDQLNKIVEDIRNANSDRVKAIHGIWRSKSYGAIASLMNLEPDGNAEAIHGSGAPLSAQKMEQLATRLENAHIALAAFYAENRIIPGARISAGKERAKLARLGLMESARHSRTGAS